MDDSVDIHLDFSGSLDMDEEGREVTVVGDAPLQQWAGKDSAQAGTVRREQVATALFWCEGDEQESEDIWWVIKPASGDPINNGARLHVIHTFQLPTSHVGKSSVRRQRF